jgi:glycosyltransferase involved in cell wall biosynthesis
MIQNFCTRVHIALFNRSFHPDTAATGQLLTELCVGLAKDHNCRVSVVAGPALLPAEGAETHASWGLVRRESYCGVQILRSRGTRFSKKRFLGRATNYLSYFLSACYAGLTLERPDLIVSFTDPPIIGLAAYLAARRFGVPLVMVFQDIFPEVAALLEDFHSAIVDAALRTVNRFLVRRAAQNIVIGETMRKRLIEGKGADAARTVVISNWADCSEIVPVPRANDFSRMLGLNDKFVVMHSGNVGLSQDLPCIIDVAERLKSVTRIRFLIVGEGIKKNALVADVRRRGLENVLFLPYQDKAVLKESFGSADVFIISLKRGLAGYIVPSKLYGILAAGRPYVAAVEEESEVAAVTRKYGCGLVAEPGDARQIADRILTLYHDLPLLRRCGENSRNAAFEFDRRVQIRAYFDLFHGLAIGNRNSPTDSETAV